MITQEITKGYEPCLPLAFFEQICKIPHPSYREEKIADYLQSFANSRSLYCFRDAKNNILIRKEATEGYRDASPILLQGHMDMVCAKDSDVIRDLFCEGLELYIENGFLMAHGTTLGGDDGVAVAMMLALLDGELTEHPTLECLFTVEEEVGLGGAAAFDCRKISARKMINLDSETEGEVVAGCCGGVVSEISVCPPTSEGTGCFIKIKAEGLFGGHSGTDINKDRKNAVITMLEIIDEISKKQKVSLYSLFGGDKDNAIPRECTAVVCVGSEALAVASVRCAADKIKRTLSEEDKGLSVTCETVSQCGEVISPDFTETLKNSLLLLGTGVIKMCEEPSELVEFSKNLGIARIDTKNIKIIYSSRSAKDSQLEESASQISDVAEGLGGKALCYGRYAGWDICKDSRLRDGYIKKYRLLTGKEIKTVVIHAGLECGIIKSAIPDMDIISIGPDIHNIHTPNEALDLSSFARVFEVLKATILDKGE